MLPSSPAGRRRFASKSCLILPSIEQKKLYALCTTPNRGEQDWNRRPVKQPGENPMRKHLATAVAAMIACAGLVAGVHGADDQPRKPPAEAPVTIAEDGTSFTLANGFVTARVSKRNGDL